jgi:DNA-binding transcriptional regulator LsrR (DeoR family)
MKDTIKDATQKALEKRVAWIKKQLGKGRSYSELASDLGITRQRVHQICKEAGLK